MPLSKFQSEVLRALAAQRSRTATSPAAPPSTAPAPASPATSTSPTLPMLGLKSPSRPMLRRWRRQVTRSHGRAPAPVNAMRPWSGKAKRCSLNGRRRPHPGSFRRRPRRDWSLSIMNSGAGSAAHRWRPTRLASSGEKWRTGRQSVRPSDRYLGRAAGRNIRRTSARVAGVTRIGW